MATDAEYRGGIERSGSTMAATRYTVSRRVENRPVTYVSWFDAARFCNWLAQRNARRERRMPARRSEGRIPWMGPRVVDWTSRATRSEVLDLPSEDEWYKAAYHEPQEEDPEDDYWLYPTRRTRVLRERHGPAERIGEITNDVAANIGDAKWELRRQPELPDRWGFLRGERGTLRNLRPGRERVGVERCSDQRFVSGAAGRLVGTDSRTTCVPPTGTNNPDFENIVIGFRVASP